MKKLVFIFMLAACTASAQTAPGLGRANSFGLLSGGSVSATDTIIVKGKAGASSGISSKINADSVYSGTAIVTNALTDLSSAKSFCTTQTGTSISGALGTQTLSAGVYTISGNATLYDTLTLTGDTNAVFIFNISGNFNSDSVGKIKMFGILASKIYWNIGGTTTMGLYSNVSGTIMSAGVITLAGVSSGSLTLLSLQNVTLSGPQIINHPSDFGYRIASHQKMNVRDQSEDCTDPLPPCNLVSNPGFEVVDDCPDDGYLYRACEWGDYEDWDHAVEFGNGGDIFSDCNDIVGNSDFGVANNIFGAQPAHSGGNYAGFAAYIHFPYLPSFGSSSAYNWFVKDLGVNLTPGVPYYVEYYVSLSDNSNKTAPLEVLAAYDVMDVLGGTAQSIFTTSTITSTSTWTKVAGCFTPVASNLHAIVMKFSTPAASYTSVSPSNPPGSNWPTIYPPDSYAYYFIDDMAVRSVADAGPDLTVCSNATIGSACTPIVGATYAWTVSGPGSVSFSSTTAVQPVVTFTTPGTYTFTLTTTYGGCVATDNTIVTVTMPAVAIASAPSPAAICPGGFAVLTASGAGSYSWAGGPATAAYSVSPATTTTYTVTGTTGSCSATATITVTINPVPTITASATPPSVLLGSSSTLNSTSSTGTYNWTPAATLSSSTAASPTATPYITTTYTVSTTNSYGCSASATTTVTVTYAQCGLTINNNITSNTTAVAVFGASTVINKNIHIAAGVTLTITSDISFSGCNFNMEPGAKIVVQAPRTLTITDKTHFFSCGDMWDGIYVPTQARVVITNNSFIEDALNAVATQYDGTFNINTAIFNRNLKAIDVQAAGHPSTITSTIANSIITSRIIPSYVSTGNTANYSVASLLSAGLTSFTTADMRSPNQAFKGVYGIAVTDAASITLGIDAASSTNTFDAIMCGIYLYHANAVIYNNRFQHLLNPTVTSCLPGPCYNEAGYGIKAVGATSGAYSVTIGGNATYKENSFYNCYRAVELTDYKTNVVVKNSIDNAVTATSPIGYGNAGIYVKPASNNTIVITDNAPIRNCATAIWINRAAASAISTNVLQVNSNGTVANPVTANSSGYCSIGIYLTDLAAGTTVVPTTSEIKNNVITETVDCISLSNVKKPVNIESNSVTVKYATTGARNGIKAIGCEKLTILTNHTKYNNVGGTAYTVGGNILAYGIYLQNSSSMIVKCNLVEDAARSMVFEGTCTSPMPTGYGIMQNTMRRAQDGFVLLNSGIIGQQGRIMVVNIPSNNYWDLTTTPTFTRSQTYTETSGANTTSKLYMNNVTSGANATMPVNNQTSLTGGDIYTLGTGLNILSNVPAACGAVPAFAPGGGEESLYEEDSEETNELGSYENMISEMPQEGEEISWMRKKYVFDAIANGEITASSNSLLDSFYNASVTFATLRMVEAAIVDKNYTQAAILNNGIVPSNGIEQNLQAVTALVLLHLQDSTYVYTDDDKNVLYAIANLCPVTSGNAVYQARNLLMSIEKNVIVFEDNCELKQRRLIVAPSAVSEKQAPDFRLFPNPNNGNMTLKYSINANDIAFIQITDITGKQIARYSVPASTNAVQINNEQLENGIYIYHIIVNNKPVKSDKLLIIK